jgi:hypothetical protein
MPYRLVAFTLLLIATLSRLHAQQALNDGLPGPQVEIGRAPSSVDSAWIDLRQKKPAHSKPQAAPNWVEAVSLISGQMADGSPKAIFRLRLAHPAGDYHVLFFRLFFDDKADARPELVCWDESGSQVLRSGALGAGIGLATSDSEMIPMNGVSVVDIEVPGDGQTIRGAYLDWMTSSEVVHPLSAEHRDIIPEPFSASPPLHAPENDLEQFGTVKATLAAETIPIGPEAPQAASLQFEMESVPLLALITFDVASPRIDSPPEIYVNGELLGPVNLTLPELADPGYRGEMESMVKDMQFQYTGWLRAQKIIPATSLKTGKNDILIFSGAATPTSAIRSTQIQLKYLWDKSDYQLRPTK